MMTIYGIYSYTVLTVVLYQIVHSSYNKGIFSYVVLLCYYTKILIIITKNKSQNSPLYHVVLDTQSKYNVYPWHFSNAKCTLALLTLSLS